MKRFIMRRIVTALCATGMLGLSSQVFASGFQLWEQDGATPGNYHAGYAVASNNDASTAWYNPAGIVLIQNQQVVLGTSAILSDFKYKGTISVNTLGGAPMTSTSQGGNFSLVPALHYVTPINEKVGFGFSIDAPFGLKTDYGRSTPVRYASTLSSLSVVDLSPSLGFLLTDKFSLGIGFDVQKASAELDNVGGAFTPAFDTDSTNKATGTGYGYHAGALYQFSKDTRLGLSYHSQVVQHLSGTSKFVGPIADFDNGGPIVADRSTVNITLPPYTALSLYERVHPQVVLLGSIIYTQWDTFQELNLNNVAGIDEFGNPSTSIQVSIPENYRNSWNFSLGADYFVTDRATLRGALGYDETPVNNHDRNLQLPDNNRYVLALGGHYQATRAWGFDLGWTHLFISQARVTPPPQETGAQVTETSGNVDGGADVFSAQVTWNIV